MKRTVRLGATALGACLALAIGLGCHDQGPMERAGATIDEKLDEASDEIGRQDGDFQAMGEKLDEAAAHAREKMDEARERVDGD